MKSVTKRPRRLPKWKAAIACVFPLLGAIPSAAHEFWIDPEQSRLQPGDTISANLRVGEDLSGSSYPYVSKTVGSMTHWSPAEDIAINAREGDRPAISNVMALEPGLHRLTVQTNPAYIVFDDISEFEAYLEYEGLEDILDLHRARGLPATDIAEAYVRNAKSLVQIGPVDLSHNDQATDLPFELTMEGNPFVVGVGSLDVHLTWKGKSVPNAPVAMFHLARHGTAPKNTRRTLLHTNDEGRASLDLSSPGEYLVNAVRMSPVDGPGSVVWESYWASLTFRISR